MAQTESTRNIWVTGMRVEHDLNAKDREKEPEQQIDRDLGRRGGQEDRGDGWCIGVCVRQPDVEREQGQFERDPDRYEGQCRIDGPGVLDNRQPGRQVSQVEGSRDRIEHAHPDHEERCPDRSHDQVLVGREQRAPVLAEGYQGVGRQGRDLEEHKCVEGVIGNNDAEQTGQAQQEHGVEPGLLVGDRFPGPRWRGRRA